LSSFNLFKKKNLTEPKRSGSRWSAKTKEKTTHQKTTPTCFRFKGTSADRRRDSEKTIVFHRKGLRARLSGRLRSCPHAASPRASDGRYCQRVTFTPTRIRHNQSINDGKNRNTFAVERLVPGSHYALIALPPRK